LLNQEALKDVKILVVDDDEALGWTMQRELSRRGSDTQIASSSKQAVQLFHSFQPDLVISDIRLPDGNGMELLKEWRSESPQTPIILATAHADVDSAVKAFRLGVFDYLQKPFQLDDLLAAVTRAAEVAHLRQKLRQFEENEAVREPLVMVGSSQSMLALRNSLNLIARSRTSTALIYGETGTGKELAARALHEWSTSAEHPFIEINCASIPENLLESELFGYEKGAFTDARSRKFGLFEVAKKGTIFLDEIGEMPPKLQAKLLRVLEHRRFKRLGGTKDILFEARVVAATNRNIKEQLRSGDFRLDLYYRLSAISLSIPPLRDRLEDTRELATFLMTKIASELCVTVPTLSGEALEKLRSHDWPGNIRELRNVLTKTMVMSQPKHIEACHIEIEQLSNTAQVNHFFDVNQSIKRQGASTTFELPDSGISLDAFEQDLLVQALNKSKQNQSKAADLLGITRHTLRYRMEKFGLTRNI
jgi:two-component system response regulator AtoC